MEHDFSHVLQGFEQMGVELHKIIPKTTLKAAKIIKSAIVRNLPRSKDDEKKTLQWKGKMKYVHMQDDVKITTLKEDVETLDMVRHLRGGKYTHYKWKWWEFGTSKLEGNQFMTRSLKETNTEVQKAINDDIKKVID
jgi:HK97 gp10 family phage protein